MSFRNIVTLVCQACGNQWVGPDLVQAVRCPKCHSPKVAKENARVEKAPLQ